jgi:hypothetical protein
MFQLDGGVQLTSITGSPADPVDPPSANPTPAAARTGKGVSREWSCNSLLNAKASRDSYDSLFDTSKDTYDSLFDATMDDDSIFGGRSIAPPQHKQEKFSLKGLRPDSFGSNATTSSETEGDRTFRGVYGGCEMSPIPKGPAASYEAVGDDGMIGQSRIFLCQCQADV